MKKSERASVVLMILVLAVLVLKGMSMKVVDSNPILRRRNHNKNHNNRNSSSSSSSSSIYDGDDGYDGDDNDEDGRFCLSWRMGVEANNVVAWRTVPIKCEREVEKYMIEGQYDLDLNLIMDQISPYLNSIITLSNNNITPFDSWILDVDDTCISNSYYYKSKKYGCDPYDPLAFRAWAMKGGCPAISAVQQLFNELIEKGFKVFLVTGRDEETLGQVTINNLHNQGYIGYERLILRSAAYRGQSAVKYKSDVRKKLEKEGYRIWGNVGDQWSDLHGDSPGNRTFKLPNPMYFVP